MLFSGQLLYIYIYIFDASRKSNPSLDLQHSMGGKVAAMTALLHQHLVSSLAVLDIAPVSYLVTNIFFINWGEFCIAQSYLTHENLNSKFLPIFCIDQGSE